MPKSATVHSSAVIPAAASFRDGDVLLLREPGFAANAVIGCVQRRLLRDLGCAPRVAGDCARYTHVALLFQVVSGEWMIVEMTWPRCRTRPLGELPPGTLCLARRPQSLHPDPSAVGGAVSEDADAGACHAACLDALRDALARRRYPTMELLSYWCWSWPCKLLGRKFREVFRDREADVCSGSVWRWLRGAGLFPEDEGTCDARPEAWYPARLAAETLRFRTVASWRVP